MVVISAAITTKSGKTLLSRQFVEISRVRIEGLLAAFPKLMTAGKQHTFIETEAVRYVYQPLNTLYMVLITNKSSNIMEDLDTLQMLAKIVPDYCRNFSESEILARAFELIFAFDEVLALGYKEKVSLQQIRTFLAMESQEERVQEILNRNKEREAREEAERKRGVMEMSRMEMGGGHQSRFGGGSGYSGGSSGYGGGSTSGNSAAAFGGGAAPSWSTSADAAAAAPAATAGGAARAKSGHGMKLATGTKSSAQFMQQLVDDGDLASGDGGGSGGQGVAMGGAGAAPAAAGGQSHAAVEIDMSEVMTAQLTRDGGVERMEVKGVLTVTVFAPEAVQAKVQLLRVGDTKAFSFRAHPTIDKALFASKNVLELKGSNKAYTVGSPLPLVRWRFQSSEESDLPLLISCWPTASRGGVTVNLEYELLSDRMALQQLVVEVPIPGGVAPQVGDADGQFMFDAKRATLLWRIDAVSPEENTTGSLEFSLAAEEDPDRFFPITATFSSATPFSTLQVERAVDAEGNDLDFHVATSVSVDSFTVD